MKWVPKAKTTEPAVSTARPKVSTDRVVNTNRVNMGNAMKASTHWEWRPKGTNTSTNPNGVSMTFDRFIGHVQVIHGFGLQKEPTFPLFYVQEHQSAIKSDQ